MSDGYTRRQRQKIREQMNKHRRDKGQWTLTFADGVTVEVSADEAARAAVYGVADVRLK